jgi:IPT/TIG domain
LAIASFKEAGLKRSCWGALALLTGIGVLLGGCGSSTPVDNATPIITNLFPSNITAGSAGFTLAITGTGLISSTKGVTFAYWNGSPRSTTYDLTTNQLEVAIPASDLLTPGAPQLTLWNPPPGGGESQVAATFTVEPVAANGPTISSISPTSAKAGGADFTLMVTGTNFAAGDVIAWNGVPLTTSVSGDQASATIPAADITEVGTGSVTVSTPGLVIAAPSVAFPITGPNNPSPTASSLSPSRVAAGGPDFEVILTGSGFNASSVAEWNGVGLATAYVSGSRLVILIPATDTASSGTAQITVTNPMPGGGTSSELTFTVDAAQ